MNKRDPKAWPRMIRQARACSLTHEAAMTQSIAVPVKAQKLTATRIKHQ